MIERAVFLKDAISVFVHVRNELSKYALTEADWELVEFLLRFLAPFKEATNELQTGTASLHKTFLTYERLFNGLDDVKSALADMMPVPSWINEVGNAIEAMWAKLRKYYAATDKPFAYVDSVILHPAKKLSLFKKETWEPGLAERYRDESRARFNSRYNMPEPDEEPPSPDRVKSIPAKRGHSEIDSGSDSECDSEFNEFDHYLRGKREKSVVHPLAWWAKSQGMFPKLSKMVRDVYAVPPTGCGVEREFSISGRVVTKQRNRLCAKTIRDIMQYKRWVARNGVPIEMTQNGGADPEEDGDLQAEDNKEVIEWVKDWRMKQTLRHATECLTRL